MFRSFRLACLALAFAASFAHAAGAPPQDPSTLAGHYYLEGGGIEVGSELLIKPAGKFEWMLEYGAMDYMAQGTWKLDGERLVLSAAPPPEPVFRIFGADDYHRTKPAEPGTWIAIVGVPGVGPVGDMEVRFEARSGKAASAVSKPNGDAIVKMPANEVWTRAGLRRAGGEGAWQWFDVPADRAATRLVGFVLTNIAAVQPRPFESMTLRVAPAGLVVEEGAGDLRGTYAKH